MPRAHPQWPQTRRQSHTWHADQSIRSSDAWYSL